MLKYIGKGFRQYGRQPLAIIERRWWEFQAVVKGAIGPLVAAGPEMLRERRLWLFPPRHRHGWIGEGGKSAEVAVFHFVSVPEPVGRLAQGAEYLEVALDEASCHRMRKLVRAADRYWQHPAPGMFLCHEHVLLELSLLIFEGNTAQRGGEARSGAQQRVTEAIRYFTAHLEENPSLEEVARKVGASAVHLRRLFHEVLQAAPKQIFDQLRFQRAMQLMTERGMKLESVGEACGFQSASAFSRAFKIKFGCSPQSWRG